MPLNILAHICMCKYKTAHDLVRTNQEQMSVSDPPPLSLCSVAGHVVALR